MTINEMYEYIEGYKPHYNHFDAEIVGEGVCEECEGKCYYKGFIKGKIYRAFIICKNCDSAFEF